MNDKEKKQKALERVLGEPIGFAISEAASKARKGLILVSFVVLVLVLGEVSASEKVSILGLELAGITSEKLLLGLLAVLIYSLVNYIWLAVEVLGEWVIRITGTRVGFITAGTFADEDSDHPNDPKQSTLYNWWRENTQRVESSAASLIDIQSKVDILLGARDADADSQGHIKELSRQVASLSDQTRLMNAALSSQRIEVSLKRFNRWFELVLRSQNLRVLLVDLLFPLLLGLFALAMVVTALSWV